MAEDSHFIYFNCFSSFDGEGNSQAVNLFWPEAEEWVLFFPQLSLIFVHLPVESG